MARRRVNVAVAGQNFGIDLPEIGQEGAEKTESVLADYFPELKLSFGTPTGKTTRGGRLGRQTLPMAQEITLKQALPKAGDVNVTTNVTTEKAPTGKVFEGKIGSATIEEIGGRGFGMKDYTAAIEAGYTPESIKEYVTRNKETLYNIGPEAQKTLGITGYVSTQPGAFNYAAQGGPGFGMKDIESLKQRGVSQEAMLKLAAQAPVVGPEAAKFLGYAPTGEQTKGQQFLASFNPAAAGGAGFGLKDITELKQQGISTELMKAAAAQAPRVGPDAAKLLEYTPTAAQAENLRAAQASAPTPQKQPWENFDYAAYGQAGFGMEDMNALEKMGAPLKTIRELALKAPGGQIGAEARKRLGL